MSKNLRRNIERRRRRLEEMGALTIEFIEDADDFSALLDWTIATKARWLRGQGLQSPFVQAPHYRAFWLQAQRARHAGGRICGMALRLNGQTVASKVFALTANRMEGFNTTFDDDFSRFSPSQILMLETCRWCAAEGLVYDFRIGNEAYKWNWTETSIDVTSYAMPLSLAGRVLHRARVLRERALVAKNRLRTKIPARFRKRAKKLLSGGAPTEAPL